MTFDEFATVLTSYGEDLNVSWRTVKHLLLFRVYEKLHDRLMKASEEAEEAGEAEEIEDVGIYGLGEVEE
jgi:CRISPR-associated protein Cst1